MSLCQLHNSKIFGHCVNFLQTIIQILYKNECFKGIGFSNYCLNTRKGKLEPMLNKIDSLTGLSFRSNFSFALSGHLLKGLKTSGTKAATSRLLTDILDSS